MKKIWVVSVVLGLLVLNACSKKHGYPVTHSVQQNNSADSLITMDAKINGEAWHTDSAYAYRVKYANDTTMEDIYVTATRRVNDTLSTLSFTIVNYTGVQNYLVAPPQVSATYYIGSQRHYATLGQINIETDGPYSLIGTFNFTVDSTVVSDGSFNVAKP